jgi:hypothetical protein
MNIHNKPLDPVGNKMKVLKEFRVLSGCTQKEKRLVRDILANCKSELEMERKIYNLLRGTESPAAFIAKYMPSVRQN